jgi:uncharacterized membrane protein HdeD (DUF308 family)
MTEIEASQQYSAKGDLRRIARTTSTLTIVSGVSAVVFGLLVLIWPTANLARRLYCSG